MPLAAAIDALKQNDFAKARKLIQAEDESAYTVRHYLIKGLSEFAMRDWAAAQSTFEHATNKFPDHAALWFNKGNAEENLKRIDEAIQSHERCLRLKPEQAEACGNLSNLYRKTRRYVDAEKMALRALENGAPYANALNSLGLALQAQGKFDDALKAFNDAHNNTPNNSDIIANLANLSVDRLHFEDAWASFAKARAIDDKPQYRHDEALARMLTGDYERGLPLFEARLELPDALRLIPAFPRWKGEPLQGKKLLIVAEQGFGDVLHFCRYQEFIPEGDLVWAVPKSLVRLLSGRLRGTVCDENDPLPHCDLWVPILSLGLLGLNRDMPLPINFTPRKIERTLPHGTHKYKIGLVWSGSHTHPRDDKRSVPLKLFKPFLAQTDADFYAPFIGQVLDKIEDLPIHRLDNLITDFADTADLLSQMDRLITVDTAVAHLAGSLGLRTLLLLPHCPDWRWGIDGDTTPLYPSLTLIRQKTKGDWTDVLNVLPMFLSL